MLARITFEIPYVMLNVMPLFSSIDKDIYKAAFDLGADHVKAFTGVILPQLWPGILSGFLMAMTMSIDDFSITYFTRGAGVNTLSTMIYTQLKRGVNPAMYEMIMENANIALIYSGEANAAILENESLAYEVPVEGSNLWMDSWVIPRTCRHKGEAESFINFMCRPDVAYANWDHVYYTTPNTGVYEMLDEDEQRDDAMFPPEEVLDRCEVFRVPDDDEMRLLQEMWKELKIR